MIGAGLGGSGGWCRVNGYLEKLCRLLALHDETFVDELLIDLLDFILVIGLVSGPFLDLAHREESTVLL